MGDPDQKFKRQSRRKRNFIAKELWQNYHFKHKVHAEVRRYEDEDWKQELEDYFSETYD